MISGRAYKQPRRYYDLLAVGSVMFGRIIHPYGTKRILNLVSFITNDKIELKDLAKAIRFCGPRLTAGPAWRFANARDSFLELGVELDILESDIEDFDVHRGDIRSDSDEVILKNVRLDRGLLLREAKIIRMKEWLADEEKKRTKGFSLGILDKHYRDEWLELKLRGK